MKSKRTTDHAKVRDRVAVVMGGMSKLEQAEALRWLSLQHWTFERALAEIEKVPRG